MNKALKRILFFSVLGITLVLSIPARALMMRTYLNNRFNYSIQYPADYEFSMIGTRVIFSSPDEDKQFGFSPNVNVSVTPLDNPKTKLDEFYAQSKAALPSFWGNAEIISDKKDKINGVPAYRLVCTTRQKKAVFKIMQAILISRGNAYVITYTALQSQYDNYFAYAQAMFNSLRY